MCFCWWLVSFVPWYNVHETTIRENIFVFFPGIKQANPIQQKDMMNFTFTFFLGVARGGSSRDCTRLGSPYLGDKT